MKKLRTRLRNNERGRRLRVVTLFLVLGALLYFACGGGVPDDIVQDENVTGIIFVKTTRTNTLNSSFSRGGNLFSLIPASPDGKLTNLTNLEEGDVCDPEISYDGLKVLFSMRRNGGDDWHIYEMNVDGSNLKQLTFGEDDDFDPTYLPNGKILFTSNRPGFIDEYNKQRAEVMHVMNGDGSNIECISFNQSDDFDPIVRKNGQIVYTRWEHHGPINRFPLFFTNPDGHGTFTFFSPHKKRTFFHPREMADGSIVAIHSDRVNGDRGQVVVIKQNTTAGEPMDDGDLKILTPDVETNGPPFTKGAFKYPVPLTDGRILVSYSPRFGQFGEEGNEQEIEPDYGLYTMNSDGSDLKLLYNDPAFHEYDAVVIGSRPVPPVSLPYEPNPQDQAENAGVFLVENVYFRQSNDGQVRPDPSIQEVKEVMVIEGIPRQRGDRDDIGMSNFEQKRIIGTAPVQADGSFKIKVPANTALSFNTLDSLGRALVVKRNWVTVRPGEQFGKCTGCHGPRGQDSGNPAPMAANITAFDLNVPVSQREDVSFGVAIEPIIAAKCVSCHSGATPGGGLDLSLTKSSDNDMFSIAYKNLMDGNGLVREPFSRRSRLIDILLGIGDNPGTVRHPDPSGANALTADEIRKFINWIDLGGQYR